MADDIGGRMKEYESSTSRRLMPLLPVVVRLDGKCFHNCTKKLDRPFDADFIDSMQWVAMRLMNETNALAGYVQSDEVSLLLYSGNYKSKIYFDGKPLKICSVLASITSLNFSLSKSRWSNPGKFVGEPVFDCRAFNLPTKFEAVNAFLWREQDAVRNSIQMVARSHFSHKRCMHKNCDELQEMLFSDAGVNWNDFEPHLKRGKWLQRRKVVRPYTFEEIDSLPIKHNARNTPSLEVSRSEVILLDDAPQLSQMANKVGFLFEGELPIIE